MKLYDAKLLTVTCEILAQKNIIEILDRHKVSGYTTYEADGNGDKGVRGKGFKNEKNVKIEIVLHEDRLQDVVEEIARTMFSNYAIILYVGDIKVLRPEKFN